jgi:cell division protein FtsI (penicillin-binding protein 3)
MNVKTNILMRIYFVFGVISVAGCLVLWKVYEIQQFKDDYWVKKAEKLSTKFFTITAERGNIYSSDERLLATSLPYFDIYVDLGAQGMKDEIFNDNIDALSKELGLAFSEKSAATWKKDLIKARKQKKRYYPIAKRVSYDLKKTMETWPLFREGRNTGGMIAEIRHQRINPYGHLAVRTIGYVRENAPDVGLEARYNRFLSGKDGKVLKQKIAGDVWMPVNNSTRNEPLNGKDIITTLQVNLQDAAEEALWKALDSSKAEFGCAVVMEVKTGAIRAMANLGRTKSGTLSEINNYAVLHSAQPGSTFKLASYLALLDAGAITTEDTIYIGSGSWNFYGNSMKDDHPGGQYLTAKEAFAASSNVAVARWMDRHFRGRKKELFEKWQSFGLTQKSGIDLDGEPTPVIGMPDKWSKLSVPWKATGYEVMLTPLQLLTFYNAVANDGVRVVPYLVESVTSNGRLVQSHKPVVAEKPFASPVAIKQAKALLREVVENPKGTARGIRSDFIPLAGKTGTAKLYKDGQFTNSNQAMFAGYFPADKPLYSCIVMIYNPQGVYRTGGSVAAPVFRAIADRAMSTDLKASTTLIAAGNPKPNAIQLKGEVNQVRALLSRYGYPVKVGDQISYLSISVNNGRLSLRPEASADSVIPDLNGLHLDDAIYILENAGLKIRYQGMGKVISQSLPPGTKAAKGDFIHLQLGMGI